jgi:hypothetical protein
MLAQLAIDACYRAVIAKNNRGLPIIHRIVKSYSKNVSIQTSCSTTLQLLLLAGGGSHLDALSDDVGAARFLQSAAPAVKKKITR